MDRSVLTARATPALRPFPHPHRRWQFRLWLAGRKTGCLLSLDIDTGTASAGTCQDGAPNPLLHASAVARHKGGLILTDAAGDAVAEFAVGEGFAYEAVAPAGRLMALSAVD